MARYSVRLGLLLLATSLSLAGCTIEFQRPGPRSDAGAMDSGRDAGLDDAGLDDAGLDDAGLDGSPADTGVDGGDDSAPNLIFVTSGSYSGVLGGVGHYDEICAQYARTMKRTGTFIALMSSDQGSARARLGDARGWVNTAGMPFADTVAELAAGQTFGPILDEYGRSVPNERAWSGSDQHLELNQGSYCFNWTVAGGATLGEPNQGSHLVFDGRLVVPCTGAHRIYCAQTDRQVEVQSRTIAGPSRRLFITGNEWQPIGGVEAADAFCQAEANRRAVSGVFIALIADVGRSAISRLTGHAASWVRLDGALLWDPVAGPADFSELVTSPSMTIDGDYGYGWGEWTGAASPAERGTVETTCNGWSGREQPPEVRARKGSELRDAGWFGGEERPCTTGGRLYCIEQLRD